jgi:signal transduction histidine kinase
MTMRRRFAVRSFAGRITWLVTLTGAFAIVAVSLALATINSRDLRRNALASLQAQAAIVALNSGAPLVFGDHANAAEVLASLRAMPSVTSATLFALDGTPFARYLRDPLVVPEPRAFPPGISVRDRDIVSVIAVQEKGQPLGRLQVTYDATGLHRQLWGSIAIAAVVSLAALGLMFLAAQRAIRVVIAPLAGLTRTARRVSETRDYGVRARKISDDEIGAFTDTFNEMLAQIQQQDIDLKASRAEAESASRMKDEFLATLSHELRTPMTPILGWAQILQRIALGNPRILQAADVIERNALSQTRIIDDLLDMSRIMSGKIGLEMASYDIAATLASAIETVRGVAESRGISIDVEADPELPPLTGDRQRIEQVLWNLLSNAIKFSSDGGEVRASVRREGNSVEVAVADDGKGITAEFLPHVFERFRQADSSVTRVHGGLGLGLAIAQQIVELHGGSVEVSSGGAGQGATFIVRLPIPRHATAPVHTPDVRGTTAVVRTAGELPLAGLQVLVVDDENDAREWLVRVLADAGADVRAARSAAEALEVFDRAPPDVLLSDIGMPEVDGYALIRRIRALPEDRGGCTPAVALTAFARADDRQRALNAGYQLHIGKPVDEDELIAAVASALHPN